jgi:hypothetical protein
MYRFLLGACILNSDHSYRQAKDVAPSCAPLLWLARAQMGAEIVDQERRLRRGLTVQERDVVLQWVGDASRGHNTAFQSVWNVRNLGTRLQGQLHGILSFAPDGTLLLGSDTLTIATLR